MRLGRYLDDRLAHAKARAGREVRRREVEVDEEVVSKYGERLAVGNELGALIVQVYRTPADVVKRTVAALGRAPQKP